MLLAAAIFIYIFKYNLFIRNYKLHTIDDATAIFDIRKLSQSLMHV